MSQSVEIQQKENNANVYPYRKVWQYRRSCVWERQWLSPAKVPVHVDPIAGN